MLTTVKLDGEIGTRSARPGATFASTLPGCFLYPMAPPWRVGALGSSVSRLTIPR
ncbi:MAG: hypothetical protein ACTHK3_07215 [Solirubrobacterales bacterium]